MRRDSSPAKKRRPDPHPPDELKQIAAELIHTAVDAIVTIDQRGLIESFNPGAERMFGYTADEAVGRNVGMLMPETIRDEHDDYIAKYLRTGRKRIIGIGREVQARHKDGRTFPVDLAVSEVQLPDRRLFTGVLRDLSEHKRVEEDLRRERDFAERVLDTAQAIVLVLDPQGRVVRFNRFTAELTGYRLEEVEGRDWFEMFFIERDRAPSREVFDEALRGRIVHGRVSLVRTRRGEERPVEWYANTLRGPKGGVLGLLCIGHDITERLQVERQVAAQHAVAAALAESRSVGEATPRLLGCICEGLGWDLGEMWHVDPTQGVLRWDGMWHVASLQPGEFGEISRRMVFTAADGLPGRVWSGSKSFWVPDVTTEPDFVRGSIARQLGLRGAYGLPLQSGTGVIGVLVLFRSEQREPDANERHTLDALGRQIGDFIQRKLAEEALLQLATIVESSEDAIVGNDLHGRIFGWNSGAEKMLGYSAVEVRGRLIDSIVPHDRRGDVVAILDRIAAGEVIEHYEAVWLRKDGETLDVSMTLSPMRDVHGNVIGVSTVARDVTARKQAEAQLREYQELAQRRERLADLGAITAKLAHDLGNPLGAVSMQAQLIVRRARRDPDRPVSSVVKAAEQIIAEVGRLNSTVRDLMTLVREQRLDLRDIPLGSFLREIVALWGPLARERGAELCIEAPRNLPALYGDAEKLRRVFDNLVKNAVEAIEPGPGAIRIRVTLPTNEKVRISVEDEGSGIPEHLKVFGLFETTKSHGTGLGLAIARQMVIAHGGGIEFERRLPRGTVFHVELPRKATSLS